MSQLSAALERHIRDCKTCSNDDATGDSAQCSTFLQILQDYEED